MKINKDSLLMVKMKMEKPQSRNLPIKMHHLQ